MNPSQAERLRSMIEDEILSSKLKPGDKLDESKLAEKFGTSRTPVREALRQLSSNGLIEIRPHKSAIVTQIGFRELVELFEVMAELEGACGRFAAKTCLKSDLQEILAAQEICRQCADADDVPGFVLANEGFHNAIYRASRNNTLIKLTQGIQNRIAPYRKRLLEQGAGPKLATEDHDRIIKVIVDGLPDEADRLLQHHLLQLGGELRQLVSMFSTFEAERQRADSSRRFHGTSSFESVAAK